MLDAWRTWPIHAVSGITAGGKVFTMLDIGYVYMDIYLPTVTAGRVKIGDDARIVLDAYPDRPIPAKVSNALIGIGPPPGPEARLFVALPLALEWAAENPDDGSAAPGPEMLRYIVERISGTPLHDGDATE